MNRALYLAMSALVEAGYSLIPCDPHTKRPDGALLPVKFDEAGNPVNNPKTGRPKRTWKPYQERLPEDAELRLWSRHDIRPAIVYGAIAGGAELLDWDRTAAGLCVFAPWLDEVRECQPDLAARLCIVRTPSGAYHVPYRCPGVVVPGNHMLAAHYWLHPSDPAQDRTEVLVETRGEGGYALCPPSAGYRYERGHHLSAPVISAAERELLCGLARRYSRGAPRLRPPAARPCAQPSSPAGDGAPWDAYDDSVTTRDVVDVFVRHGWEDVGDEGEGAADGDIHFSGGEAQCAEFIAAAKIDMGLQVR
jgi:hypothetical protein